MRLRLIFANRSTAVDRRYYLNSRGKDEKAAEVQQRIDAIEAEIAPLYAAAKQKMLKGLSESLATDASVLQSVSKDVEKVGDSMDAENKRHHEAMAKLIAEQQERNSIVEQVCNALVAAAEDIVDGDTEQAEPVASGAAGSSNQVPTLLPKMQWHQGTHHTSAPAQEKA